MKARFLFFLLMMLLSASSFAATYRVFAIRGTAQVTAPNGVIQTLTRVGQTFVCNNLRTDVKPSNGGYVRAIDARTNADRVTNIANCGTTPCITFASIIGGNRREWDDFALNGNLAVLTSLSNNLSAFTAMSQEASAQYNIETVHSTQMQKSTQIEKSMQMQKSTQIQKVNTPVLDKVATKRGN